MEKVNIANLLRDCPRGMELDCTVNDDVKFIKISPSSTYPIILRTKNGYEITLTKYGQVHNMDDSKCVIFPKGKTTWEGFVPPCKFKVGDVVISTSNNIHLISCHDKNYGGWESCCSIIYDKFDSTKTVHVIPTRFATKEEKEKLFQAIKDNGYKWNPETKTLEKLVEPKFKVGDRIKHKRGYFGVSILKINTDCYTAKDFTENQVTIDFTHQDDYELVPNKFDVTTLKPFDKVLVRDFDNETWEINFFSKLLDGKHFKCLDLSYVQCIPYEGNEHLLGTANDCDDFYKTWEK